eukprot:jgi/Mesen1/7631/ME000004S07900
MAVDANYNGAAAGHCLLTGSRSPALRAGAAVIMIYDVNSPLFRSFLSQKGVSAADKRGREDKPKEQRPKANENKPVMNE